MLLAPIVGCFATQRVRLNRTTDLAKATGLTTRSGTEIEFAVEGATMENDTLRAVGDHASIAIPSDSVARIWVHKFSARNTAGLTVGVGVAAFVVLGVIALRNFAIN